MSQTLRGRVVVKFPADVVAGPGITIDKSGATYTISATGGGGGGSVGEAPLDGQQYARQSGAWAVVITGDGGNGGNGGSGTGFVLKTGDTMTGDLTISKVGPRLILNDTGTSSNFISGRKAGSPRWDLVLGNNVSQFVLANSTVGNALTISMEGVGKFYNGIQVFTATSDLALAIQARGGSAVVDQSFFSADGTRWATIEAKPAAVGLAHDNGGHVILHAGGVNVWEARAGTVVVAASDAYKPGGGLWLATSDIRVKTVLGPYDRGLAAVCALDPVRYVYKGNDKPDKDAETSQHAVAAQKRQEYVGLVAQDTEHVMPELVTRRRGLIDNEPVDDLRDLDSTPIIYALVNAIKELTIRIGVLEGRATPKGG